MFHVFLLNFLSSFQQCLLTSFENFLNPFHKPNLTSLSAIYFAISLLSLIKLSPFFFFFLINPISRSKISIFPNFHLPFLHSFHSFERTLLQNRKKIRLPYKRGVENFRSPSFYHPIKLPR